MKYIGKSLDGFAYAFTALLEVNGIDTERLLDIDCLSFRAFAFSMGDDIQTWFCPALTWNEYMEKLSGNLGCEDSLHVEPVREYMKHSDSFDGWVLLGEVHPFIKNTVKNNFYNGIPSFYLCRRHSWDEYIISDPLGRPYQIVTKEELNRSVVLSDGFAAWFLNCPELDPADAESILKSAKAWKGKEPSLYLWSHYASFKKCYHGKVREKISLQYGLINYQLQMNKAVNFFEMAGLLDEDTQKKIRNRFQNLPAIWEQEGFQAIYLLENELWNSFRD